MSVALVSTTADCCVVRVIEHLNDSTLEDSLLPVWVERQRRGAHAFGP